MESPKRILGVANRRGYWTKVQFRRHAPSPTLDKTPPANEPASHSSSWDAVDSAIWNAMIRTHLRRLTVFVPALAQMLFLTPASAQEPVELGWPREITVAEGSIVIYQPQPESLDGNALSSRAAVSVTPTGSSAPSFGVVWLTARVDTDLDARSVSVLDVNVDRVRFPNATDEQETSLAELLQREIPEWELELSLDRLLTSLEAAELERRSDENLLSAPPVILVTTEPTVLVSLDGDPRMVPVEGSDVLRVVNTPFTLVQTAGDGPYYLHAGEVTWYTATELEGDWQETTDVPIAVAVLAPQVPESEEPEPDPEAAEPPETGPAPKVMVATEPTELIVTLGEPEYAPIDGTDLLYITNTESDVLMEIGSQRFHMILSGRWFAADALTGPWTSVHPDDLPATFAAIPVASEMGHLLISVPGTEAANEAVIESQLPQTAAIQRSEARLDVTYDGEPQFEEIEGTDMRYAINTEYSVIEIDGRFYACHEAVWFTSESATGAWSVANSVPDEVYTMPPSSPVFNVKYVYIYDTTPEVVYVGYYPGYTYSYVYGGTIVYGTGYYYTPWYGAYYYPRPATWGFHVRYNPWYGWGYGFSYSNGPFTFSVGFGGYPGGWWGPVGYRGYAYGYHRGWHAGYSAGARAGYRAGFRAGSRNGQNIYRRPGNADRIANRPTATPRTRPNVAAGRDNNVFADRNGNVARQTPEGGWQNRGSGGWQSSVPGAGGGAVANRPSGGAAANRPSGGAVANRPSGGAAANRPSGGAAANRPSTRPELDRSSQARQRGNSRAGTFQRSGAGRAGGAGRPAPARRR